MPDKALDLPPTQVDKFKDAARKLGCDEDEGRWDERLKKVAGQKPDTEKGQPKPPLP
jgi:hypothetical protein